MTVLVVAQTENNKLKKVSLEAISAGRNIVEETKCRLIVLSFETISNAESLGALGAQKVVICETDNNSEQYANIISNFVSKEHITTVLFSSTSLGNDLAARVAGKVGAGVAFNCVSVDFIEGMIQAKKTVSNLLATIEFNSLISVATISPNTQKIKIFKRKTCPVEFSENLGSVLKTVVKERTSVTKKNLENAEIVVCGGYGVKEPGNFKMIDLLAEHIGGETGATKTAVEVGLADENKHIGASGKLINPLLYIGCGVNGSREHLDGIKTSRVIVAINKNPDAPLVQNADYVILDDMWRVIPSIISELEKEKFRKKSEN